MDDLNRLYRSEKAMHEGDRAPAHATLARQVAQILRTKADGGRVVAGTDAPIDFVAISLHLNLRAMVRHGLSPVDALMTATRNAGDFLGEPIGRIAPRMLADLILVTGDPLARIEDAANVRIVIANGVVHTPEALARPFRDVAAAGLSNHVLPPLHRDTAYTWHGADYVAEARTACCADHGMPHGHA